MNVRKFKETLFARGREAGFTDMELYYQQDETFSTNIFKGEVDKLTIAADGGVSFRGLLGGKMGYAYTERLDESSISLLLEGAKATAGIIDSDDREPMCDGQGAYAEQSFFDPALSDVTTAAKVALAKALEAECLKVDPRVSLVQVCEVATTTTERYIANTRGLEKGDRRNGGYAVLLAVVRDGDDVKNAVAYQISRNYQAFDARALGREAATEALSYLGAKPVESRTYPVLLRNRTAANLLSTYAQIFHAGNVQKGKSLLQGKLGSRIAGENITIIDDPFLPNGSRSRCFDSEGVASRKVALIENGVLRSFLHNQRSAAKDGVASTGHGFKPSYKGAVTIAPSNLFIQPGSAGFDELVESLAEGLIVTEVQGLHSGANPISGDFSLAAMGYYVKNGKIVRPVNQITIAGNFYELLKTIEAVGSDLKFGSDGVGSPTLKIRGLAVAGT